MGPIATPSYACCHEWGDPAEVLRLEQGALPPLEPGQVLVEMKSAPVNPADINTIEGKYGQLPPLPARLGNEGAGLVTRVGSAVQELSPGQLVRPLPGVGAWSEALITTPERLMVLPRELRHDLAAVLCINPGTAWRVLHDFVDLAPGDWIVQNAANSAVGRFVIQLAHHLGLRTVNVVRRQELFEELRGEGADVVVTDQVRLGKEIRDLTGGARARLALNAVGGPSALELAKALEAGGTLVTYGAMGLQPLRIPNGLLIFRELRLAGFWVSAWYERAPAAETTRMLRALGDLLTRGVLRSHVEQTYSIQDIREAVAHARRPGRAGKIMLSF